MNNEEEFSTLMSNVMNIQCRMKDEDFSDRVERLTYKAGHRDARHDAVDLIAEFASRFRAQGGNTIDESVELIESYLEAQGITQAAANKAAEEGELHTLLDNILSKYNRGTSGRIIISLADEEKLNAAIAADRAARPVANKAEVEPELRAEIEKLTHYKHCMSYSDSYFGEPAGLVKQVAYQLERLIPAKKERTEEAYSEKLSKRGATAAEVRAAERVEAMHKGVVGVLAGVKAEALATPPANKTQVEPVAYLDLDKLSLSAGMTYATSYRANEKQVPLFVDCGESNAREAWEYSFTHSSAIGHGKSDIGPCLTYDKAQAFGVGCFGQRRVFVSVGAEVANKAEVEPVAFMYQDDQDLAEPGTGSCVVSKARCNFYRNETPLYATPPATTGASTTRDQALEAAARICDGVNNHDNPMTAGDCADSIRALKGSVGASTAQVPEEIAYALGQAKEATVQDVVNSIRNLQEIAFGGAPASTVLTDERKRAMFEEWATKQGGYDLRPYNWRLKSVGGVPYTGYVRPYKQDRTVHAFEGFVAALGEVAAQAGQVAVPDTCTVPPEGWYCTRPAGHDGPCAAWPCDQKVEYLAAPSPSKESK